MTESTDNPARGQFDAEERELDRLYRKLDKAEEKGNFLKAEEWRERIDQMVYGVGTTTVMELTLSGGGPSSGLEVELYREQYGWGVQEVKHWASWGSGVIREHVPQGAGLYRLAERFAETFTPEGYEQ